MDEKPKKSLFRGGTARQLKETYKGLTPHQLRLKLARMERDNAKLEGQIEKLKDRQRNIKITDEEIRRMQQQNKTLQCLLDNIRGSLSGAKTGAWVIGDSQFADLPERVAELDRAVRGAMAIWLFVGDSEKREILRMLEDAGETLHPDALKWFNEHEIGLLDPDDPEPKNRRGEIVPWARKGDKF